MVGSVSVLPHHDPSLAFVNAGMVPWKGVFQGKRAAPAPRLANSQRCVRVGGKHNDLDVVGELAVECPTAHSLLAECFPEPPLLQAGTGVT